MNHIPFQLHRIEMAIATQGRVLNFTTPGENEFGEPIPEGITYQAQGIFHETQSYVSKNSSEGSTTRSKSSPSFLILWKDAQRISLRDQVDYNHHKYKVNEVKNLMEANVVADVSLEEVQV